MNCKNYNEKQQYTHHPFGNTFQSLLQTKAAYQESGNYNHCHPKTHLLRIAKERLKDIADFLCFYIMEAAGNKFKKVAEHPSGYGGVVHHKQKTAKDAEPAVNVPLAALRFQRFVSLYCTFSPCTSHSQFHGKDRNAHDQQKEQIEQYKNAAAVFAGNVRKTPYIANADGTSGAYQQKSDSRTEVFSFHNLSS